ncbi:hypothetical protein PanWU01x14_347310 [Parasponia andersonii]|uniref:Uncharacterized protein n=1 Tax=Parasponia andersonii TaxID=3476 RepID=A0A2P5AC04_PARAD|nr:hypothetical protein PanWU01x14_347310 [Parasponia andersonii]
MPLVLQLLSTSDISDAAQDSEPALASAPEIQREGLQATFFGIFLSSSLALSRHLLSSLPTVYEKSCPIFSFFGCLALFLTASCTFNL